MFLALDLSSHTTGYALMTEDKKLIAFGEIQLSKLKKKKFPLEYIKVLYESIQDLVKKYQPTHCIIEAVFAKNVLTVKSLAKIRGIAECALVNAGLDSISELNASSVRKKVFGNGKLTKEECYEKLQVIFPEESKDFYSVGLDASDAICLALGYCENEKGV